MLLCSWFSIPAPRPRQPRGDGREDAWWHSSRHRPSRGRRSDDRGLTRKWAGLSVLTARSSYGLGMGSSRPDASPRALVWATLCVLITMAAAGCCLVGQQAARVGVDDAPRAMATRAAEQLSRGIAPSLVVGPSAVDLVTDRSPFVIVYDQAYTILASGVTVAAEPPNLPTGVQDAAATTGENHVSWQPVAGVREAVVALPWSDGRVSGVVVAGASLEPTETRWRTLLAGIAIMWLILICGATVVIRVKGPAAAAVG